MSSFYRFVFVLLPMGAAMLLPATGCRVEEDEYPEVELPAPTPLPTPGPLNPTDSSHVLLDTAHWQHFNLRTRAYSAPASGIFEFTPNGVRSVNDATGFGSVLATAYSYKLTNSDIRIIWRCYDGGASSHFSIGVADSSGYIYDAANTARFRDLNNLSTRTAYGGANLILNNVWYYTSFSSTGNQYILSTSAGNFTDSGGQEIERRTGTLSFNRGRILLRSDQPSRNGCYVLINKLIIR